MFTFRNMSPTFQMPVPPAGARGSFPTTHWSIVVHAASGTEAQARSALETLCGQYWYPLYAFVRRQGRPHHEAQDCTQEFLARLLAADGIARARPERGRFRTFLLAALRNFLTNEWHRARAAKRGGREAPLPLDFDTADAALAREPTDPRLTPEQAFDRNWALGMIDRATASLRAEYDAGGRGEVFAALGPLLWADEAEESAPAVARPGLSATAYRTALHRLRRRFGEHLRTLVAATVVDGSDVDAELRHLIAAVSNPGPAN
jgi:DNA-directed RNA polymerase specialized sigma24 family protein